MHCMVFHVVVVLLWCDGNVGDGGGNGGTDTIKTDEKIYSDTLCTKSKNFLIFTSAGKV